MGIGIGLFARRVALLHTLQGMRNGGYSARAESKDYATTCAAYAQVLTPALKVPAETPLIVVGNAEGRMDAALFHLRDVDRQPLAGLEHAGKSSHVAFSDELREIIRVLFDRGVRDTDTVYRLTAGMLPSAGYHAFHAPTSSFWLHLRLVSEDMLNGAEDVTESARRSLARLMKSNAKRLKAA
jgi:hypothetical protein